MSFTIPDNLRYTDEHEWIDPETGWMGITDFAQDELGDIVFVDLPDEGREVDAMDPFMVVESVKAVSDVYAPADGTVDELNSSIEDQPEKVNESPYDDGKFVKFSIDGDLDQLMDAEEYRDHIS
ncbi:MAG: glycine cleavage system protein GcvH [bacterium]